MRDPSDVAVALSLCTSSYLVDECREDGRLRSARRSGHDSESDLMLQMRLARPGPGPQVRAVVNAIAGLASGLRLGRITAARRRSAPLVIATLLFAACGGRTYYTPDVSGVVVDIGGPDHASVYRLADGQAFTIDITNGKVIVYGGGPPHVGDLLLGGTGSDGPWVARLYSDAVRGGRADCYFLEGFGTDRGQWIETDAGLRLPKASSFDPGLQPGVEGQRIPDSIHPGFCVNVDGQVTSFG